MNEQLELFIEESGEEEENDNNNEPQLYKAVEKLPTSPHREAVYEMRKQFYSSFQDDSMSGLRRQSPNLGHRLKRSNTERAPRKPPRDYSFDSGLSSPGSSLSYEGMYFSETPPRLTRHLSIDRIELNRSKIYRSICDLKAEAQQVQHLVDDMTSSQTMKRRRKATSSLSFAARKQLAAESIRRYTPIAPGESEWGQRFDEIIARLKGCEASPDDAHICEESECETSCVMKDNIHPPTQSTSTENIDEENYERMSEEQSAVDQDKNILNESMDSQNNIIDYENIAKNETQPENADTTERDHTDDVESAKDQMMIEEAEQMEFTEHVEPCETIEQCEPVIESIFELEQSELYECKPVQDTPPPLRKDRMCQSMTEEGLRPRDTEMSNLLRSISFYRPEMTANENGFGKLRRTDSDNEVWIEQESKMSQTKHESQVSLQNGEKKSSRWRKFTRMLSFRRKRTPITAGS